MAHNKLALLVLSWKDIFDIAFYQAMILSTFYAFSDS